MNPSHHTRSRVVPSRYKQSATEVSKKVAASHSTGCSSSGSSFENGKGRVKKPGLGPPPGNEVLGETSSCVKAAKVSKSNPKLHSTAVNSTTFFDQTQVGEADIFRNMNPSHHTRSRVVPSRYKQSATEVSKKVAASHSTGYSSSGSSFENSKGRVKKPGLGPPPGNKVLGETSSCVKAAKVSKSNPKLHSTAVNSTTFFDQTQVGEADIFSTTVVGGPGKHSNVTLAELPDISQIPPTSVIKKPKGDIRESHQPEQDDPFHARDFSMDEIKAEYLKYLTWAWIDVKSRKAFETQVEEAKRQIMSLSQLIEGEEDKLCEEQLKVRLLQHHGRVCQDYENLKQGLDQLNVTGELCAESLHSLSHHLEAKINQINLDAIQIPDPSQEDSLKEELQETLQENSLLLKDLNSCLHDRTSALHTTSNFVQDIKGELDLIEPSLIKSEKAASLVVQESSLKLSLSGCRVEDSPPFGS